MGIVLMSETRHSEWKQTDFVQPLKSSGGSCGGGSESLIVIGADMYNQTLTYDVAMAVTAARSDYDHQPSVVIINGCDRNDC